MQSFRLSGYLGMIRKDLAQSSLVCRCCGSSPSSMSSPNGTFCNFCEWLARPGDADQLHSNTEVSTHLEGMRKAIAEKVWEPGIVHADALAASKDPFLMYGASHFYKFFSDFTYRSVDYAQGGFMYSNAEKRNDEPNLNKHNAMSLISASKGCLFKSLKIISGGQLDAEHAYLKFMCNVELKRYQHAASALEELEKLPGSQEMSHYAHMLLRIEASDTLSAKEKPPETGSAQGSANFFYYLAKYLAKSGSLEDSLRILKALSGKVRMPMADHYLDRVSAVSAASSL